MSEHLYQDINHLGMLTNFLVVLQNENISSKVDNVTRFNICREGFGNS